MSPIVWAIILMVLGLCIIMLEIFVPSGGILTFLSIAAVLGSIFIAFNSGGTGTGLIFAAVALIGMPSAFVLALKWLPNTPVGRMLLLGVPTEDDVISKDDPRHRLQELVGKWGIARSAMLPGGAVRIENQTLDAVCESGSIEEGESVQVVKIRNNRLVVRKRPRQSESDTTDDVLSRPIDSVTGDPFDDTR